MVPKVYLLNNIKTFQLIDHHVRMSWKGRMETYNIVDLYDTKLRIDSTRQNLKGRFLLWNHLMLVNV